VQGRYGVRAEPRSERRQPAVVDAGEFRVPEQVQQVHCLRIKTNARGGAINYGYIINYYDISSITRVERARNMKVQCVIMNMRSMNVFNFLRSIQVLGTGDVYFTRSKISTRRKKKNIETTTTRMNHHKRKS